MVEASPSQLVARLCRALDAEGVSYCHWKSTTSLTRSATGDNDLDLLVSRVAAQPFTAVLHRLGFRRVDASREQRLPGVLDFYAYDSDVEKFIHIHAHYQLVLGDDMTKNYRLPIEDSYLRSVRQAGLFKVPAPEFELVVLVVRLVLKHVTWDALLTRQGQLPRSAKQELADLRARSCPEAVQRVLQQALPGLAPALFEDCIKALQPGASRQKRLEVGWRLQHSLRGFRRRPWVADIALKGWRRGTRKVMRRVFGPPKKSFASGGALIALVGGDGAGKSTAAHTLYSWLAKDFSALKVHLGKPRWSLTTHLVRGGLKLVVALEARSPFGGDLHASRSARVLRKVCASYDRYHAYLRARRAATQGRLVICDRFPLPQLRSMDAPQQVSEEPVGPFVRALLRLERRWYAAMSTPDVLVVLKVEPDIAVSRVLGRSPSENVALARARSAEVWACDWQATHAYVVDASRSQDQVIAQIKTFVWSQL